MVIRLFIHFTNRNSSQDRLGTWMILSVIEQARLKKLPYVYLGYFVKGCRSMNYKKNYKPNEIMQIDGILEAI